MVTGCDIIKVIDGRYRIKFWWCVMFSMYFTFASKEFVEYLSFFKRIIDYLIIVDDRRNVCILASVSESDLERWRSTRLRSCPVGSEPL